MNNLKRYRLVLIVLLIFAGLFVVNRSTGMEALGIVGYSLKEMLLVLPPIFILLGLLDVWVPKEIMVRYMGEGSGLKGIILAFVIGSAAAGPLYGAFPVAAVLMKKGAKLTNVLIFLGAWSTTKIPMFLFELTSLGVGFALTRLLIDIPGIILISYVLAALLKPDEITELYRRAETL